MGLLDKAKNAVNQVKKHADTNKDGKVDAKDLDVLKKHADVNKDGKVNGDDFKAVKHKLGKK